MDQVDVHDPMTQCFIDNIIIYLLYYSEIIYLPLDVTDQRPSKVKS